MANNLVSDNLPVQSIQMGQLEYTSNKLDSPMQMGLTPGIGNSALQPISMPNVQMGLMKNDVPSQELSIQNNQALLECMPYSNVPQQLATSNMQLGQRELQAYNEVPGHYFLSNEQAGETNMNNVGSQQSSVLNKRKAPMELISSNPASPKSTVAKRMVQMEHRPWLQQISTPHRLPVEVQQVSNTSGSQRLQLPSKRPALSKIGSQQTSIQKNQSGQRQPTPKSQNEPLESVRSKLRESLAAALASVSHLQDKISSGVKNFQSEATCSMEQTKENLQPLGQNFGVDAARHAFVKSRESLLSKEDSLAQRGSDGEKISQDTADGIAGDSAPAARNDVQGLQSSIILHHDDLSFSDSFFAKDELLQGNGLSWVLESNMEMVGREDVEITQKQLDQKSIGKNNGGEALQTPEDLASKIEAELFKLFGGVNKKYKEKGRSLLFNLKDRNNPELRERVMSREIPPERLCSMTAEELASKELSQWRMAKAEELAQMVVLPDSDVDIRRLVKKTHKGEFQVEVDQQDSVSVEVAVGVSSVTPLQPRSEEKEVSPRSKPDTARDNHRTKLDQAKDKIRAASANNNTEEQDVPCTITISSNEGTDLMQGLMVDDELKDAEFLPPIVSLDEFMESLNSEPPFEHLPGNNGKTASSFDKDNLQVDSESKSPDSSPVEATDSIPDKPDNIDMKHVKLDDDRVAIASQEKSGIPVGSSEGKRVWEGSLQLTTSVTASVFGIFKCGEKTYVKEWPGFIEIKGRVRLDAFEKFLQELPMSRSRAVMVSQVYFHCTTFQLCYSALSRRDNYLSLSINQNFPLMQHRVLASMATSFCINLLPWKSSDENDFLFSVNYSCVLKTLARKIGNWVQDL
uniref:TFIIS central domain-containing protein n=1 Tax=Rhizophora mucronata TaxID=61149 RepID=A0A2P2K2T1_RHIMU